MVHPLELQEEEEEEVVLGHALLADHSIERVLCRVVQSDVLADVRDREEEVRVVAELVGAA